MSSSNGGYYLPAPSHWPIVGSVGMFLMLFGFASFLHGSSMLLMIAGAVIIVVMLFGWFGTVINESLSGKYNSQVDTSFRMGMAWFIFSEVMFFAAFFGVLFYARMWSIPWLAGGSNNVMTNELLWPGFEAVWPTNGPGDLGGDYQYMGPWGIPAINTLLLITSSYFVVRAVTAIKSGDARRCVNWLAAALLGGGGFLVIKSMEFADKFSHGISLGTNTFFMFYLSMTFFHFMHVILGMIILAAVLIKTRSGGYSATEHTGVETGASYWHMVDLVWIVLFPLVYVIR